MSFAACVLSLEPSLSDFEAVGGLGVEDEGHEFLEGFAQLQAELDLDCAFGGEDVTDSTEISGKSGKSKRTETATDLFLNSESSDVIVKHDVAGAIIRSGNNIFRGDLKTGSISYLTHWNPAAMAGNCSVHGQGTCYFTMPLLGGDEDAMIRWLGDGPCYLSAADHMACVPCDAYLHRRGRRRA